MFDRLQIYVGAILLALFEAIVVGLHAAAR